jgi:hypothetical protein
MECIFARSAAIAGAAPARIVAAVIIRYLFMRASKAVCGAAA